MGTSGAYGGSSAQSWKNAHAAVAAMDATPVPTGSSSGAHPPDAAAEVVGAAIAEALTKQDPKLSAPFRPFRLAELVTAGRVSKVDGGRAVRSRSTFQVGSGRSPRNLQRQAARGAAAVAGAFALRGGDQESLGKLGLSLSDLSGLPVREQCQRILDDILGAPGHPDDEALRRAALETMKSVLTVQPTPTQEEILRLFLGHFVYRTALVELKSRRNKENLSADVMLKIEDRVKPYVMRLSLIHI